MLYNGTFCASHATLQSCSQLPAKEHIGQLALAVAPLTMVVFIKVNVIKVYTTCKRNSSAWSSGGNYILKSGTNHVSLIKTVIKRNQSGISLEVK